MSKLLLQNSEVMNLILKVLIDRNAVDRYACLPSNWVGSQYTQTLYVPAVTPTEAFPPIIIGIATTVDKHFVRGLMINCGKIIDKYQVEPIVLTISMDGVEPDISDMLIDSTVAPYLKRLPSFFWARDHFVMSKATIDPFLTTPLIPIVALAYVMIMQEVSITSLEHRDDVTVKMLYGIKAEIADQETRHDGQAVEFLLKICKKSCKQYKRILNALEEDPIEKKRIRSYAVDGLCYSETCLKKYSTNSELAILEDVAETSYHSNNSSRHSTPLRTTEAEEKIPDLEWAKRIVEHYKRKNERMNWQACFDTGRDAGYFNGYANAHSLKNSFNRFKQKQLQ